MQKLRNIIRKVAAISAGTVMLGATLTSALAASTATLADYPAPFADTTAKTFNFVIATGAVADAADATAAADIVTGLKSVPVSGGATTNTTVLSTDASVTSKEIPLSRSLNDATYGWPNDFKDTDVKGLQDTTLAIDIGDTSGSYNVEDKIVLTSTTKLQTALTTNSPSDNYGKNGLAFVEFPQNSVKYVYNFKTQLKTGNFLSNATQSVPISLNIFGNNLDVWTTDSTATQLTALVGSKQILKVGDKYTEPNTGKVVTLKSVGASTDVIVDVNGVQDTVSTSTKTVNGLKIKVSSTFYQSTSLVDSQATLFIGDTATTKTYTTGDRYIGNTGKSQTICATSTKDPDCWTWQLGQLNSATPSVNVSLNYPLTRYDEVVYLGKSFELPGGFIKITPQAFVTSEYQTYTIAVENGGTLYNSTGDYSTLGTSEQGTTAAGIGIPAFGIVDKWVHLHANGATKDGFYVGSERTDDIYIFTNTSLAVGEGYTKVKSQNSLPWFMYITNKNSVETSKTGYASYVSGNGTAAANMPQIRYKDATLPIEIWDAVESNTTQLNFNITHDTTVSGFASQIRFAINCTEKGPNAIGVDERLAVTSDLVANGTSIGLYENDIMTRDGVVIKLPKSNLGSDKVVTDVPGKTGTNFRVQLIIGGTGTTVTASGAGAVTLGSVATAPVVVKDTEVTTAATSNLILVGGPCVNTLTAEKLGLPFPACMDASGYKEGEGYITLKANGDKVALIVAGWSAADTQAAATMLKDYAANKAKLIGAEVKVVNTEVTTATTA